MSERHQILDDRRFWTDLEYAASQWLENSDDASLRRFWIDGFLPNAATNTKAGIDVEGTAWVGTEGRRQDQYRFVASLPQNMLHRERPGFVIERLSLDEARQTLQLTLVTGPDSKVLFRVPDEDGTANGETLWATNLGEDKYQIDNSPFYAFGVSWLDVVFAPFDKNEGFPTFQKMVSKSGHRTLRVVFDPPVEKGNKSDELLQGLVSRGCTCEGANPNYMAIDVPPDVDLEPIRNLLIACKVIWEHADPSYNELFPEDK